MLDSHGNISILLSDVHELLLSDSPLNSTDLVLNARHRTHAHTTDRAPLLYCTKSCVCSSQCSEPMNATMITSPEISLIVDLNSGSSLIGPIVVITWSLSNLITCKHIYFFREPREHPEKSERIIKGLIGAISVFIGVISEKHHKILDYQKHKDLYIEFYCNSVVWP